MSNRDVIEVMKREDQLKIKCRILFIHVYKETNFREFNCTMRLGKYGNGARLLVSSVLNELSQTESSHDESNISLV